jgi:murein DD-endopeptidase MepM/ murein hydrolase activator NlpD
MRVRSKITRRCAGFLVAVFVATGFLLAELPVVASEIDQLESQIQDRSVRLIEIEREIARYTEDLKAVGAERRTLQNAINQLEIERKKITAEIKRTENLISSTDLEISKLILEIDETEHDISVSNDAIARTLRSQYQASDVTLIELLLRADNVTEFWGEFETHSAIARSLQEKVMSLEQLQRLLTEQRDRSTEKRSDLVSLKRQYDDQTTVLANNQSERSKLLEVTKNEEANYQLLLSQRRAAREQIIKELRDFEAKLQFILDPTTIPAPGTKVFDWPLRNIIITQFFGGSEFARRNPGIYGGRAYHPGVDFGAPRGTPIYAPLTGVVRATGNTDLVPGCFSWGKWILVDHPNGLATLYAHLDTISVTPGQAVATNEIIGYTGNTGFSTGPHLHFTVYVKDGVNVRQFNEIKTVTACGPASTPVAATEAYLDPMLYLPPL